MDETNTKKRIDSRFMWMHWNDKLHTRCDWYRNRNLRKFLFVFQHSICSSLSPSSFVSLALAPFQYARLLSVCNFTSCLSFIWLHKQLVCFFVFLHIDAVCHSFFHIDTKKCEWKLLTYCAHFKQTYQHLFAQSLARSFVLFIC